MKTNRFLMLGLILMSSMATWAQNIQLPSPNLDQTSLSTLQALKTRQSSRQFVDTPLSEQELSTLCWAACGINREDGKITSPTAMNRQEIRLFVFTTNGVYEYNRQDNLLEQKATGDHRQLLASSGRQGFSQDFVLQAPVGLLMVIDFDKFGRNDEKSIQMGCVDAGIVSQNINLYCQSVGLATVPRATHDSNGIRQLLGLTDQQLPIMNNPVGHFPNEE